MAIQIKIQRSTSTFIRFCVYGCTMYSDQSFTDTYDFEGAGSKIDLIGDDIGETFGLCLKCKLDMKLFYYII